MNVVIWRKKIYLTYLLTLYSSLCSYQKIDTFSQQDNTFITFLAKSTSILQFSKDRKLTLRGWEINTLQSLLLEFFWLPWSQNPDSFQIQKLYGASIASLWNSVPLSCQITIMDDATESNRLHYFQNVHILDFQRCLQNIGE